MSDQAEQQTMIKQNYLRENIIDEGYNAQEFLAYISQKRENGGNINVWSFKELVQVCDEFKNQNQPSASQEEIKYDVEDTENNESLDQGQDDDLNNNNQIIDPVKQQTQSFEDGDVIQIDQTQDQQAQKYAQKVVEIKMPRHNHIEYEYQNQLKCTQHVAKINIYEKIKILVHKPVKKSGGLFGMSSNIYYTIITKPYNWEVKRKVKDFERLRAVLVKLFPNRIIPPLETEQSEDTPHKAQKKMKFLNSFLNDLRSMKDVWSNPYVTEFLSLQDDKKFEQILKESEKEKQIDRIENTLSFTGTTTAKITNGTYIYKEEVDKYLIQAEKSYKKLHIDTKQIKYDFQKCSSTIFAIGESIHELFGLFNDFDCHVIDGRQSHEKLKDCYISLNNIMMTWGKQMQSQAKSICDWIVHLLKYSEFEIHSLREYLKKTQEVENNYIKNQINLQKKKDKLFALDASKWELNQKQLQELNIDIENLKQNKREAMKYMCYKENQQLEIQRDIYGFQLNNTFEECKRVFDKKSDDYLQFFKDFAHKQALIMNEVILDNGESEVISNWSKISSQHGYNPFPEIKKAEQINRNSLLKDEDNGSDGEIKF